MISRRKFKAEIANIQRELWWTQIQLDIERRDHNSLRERFARQEAPWRGGTPWNELSAEEAEAELAWAEEFLDHPAHHRPDAHDWWGKLRAES